MPRSARSKHQDFVDRASAEELFKQMLLAGKSDAEWYEFIGCVLNSPSPGAKSFSMTLDESIIEAVNEYLG